MVPCYIFKTIHDVCNQNILKLCNERAHMCVCERICVGVGVGVCVCVRKRETDTMRESKMLTIVSAKELGRNVPKVILEMCDVSAKRSKMIPKRNIDDVIEKTS